MPILTITFQNPLNTSVQIGDIGYFSHVQEVGVIGNPISGQQWASTVTPHKAAKQNDIIKLGDITAISQWDGTSSTITFNMDQILFNTYYNSLTSQSEGKFPFIMFSKDNKVNMASLLGYYADVEYRNNSLEKGELFNIGAEVFESSK